MTLISVLIVDDNEELLKVFVEGLPLAGPFAVLTARDGVEGLHMFYEHHPACVVIDVKMPALDGYQLLRVFRGDPETTDVPLIILTALPQDQAEFASLASGTDQFLVKPVTPRELAQAVQQALHINAEQREKNMQRLAENE